MRRLLWALAVLALLSGPAVVGGLYAKRYAGRRLEAVVRAAVQAALDDDAKDLRRQRDRLARDQTLAFVQRHLARAPVFADRRALLERSLGAAAAIPGYCCEFGVYRGESINAIAALVPGETVHGFDSFEGLPERWRPGFEKGTYALPGLPAVRPNVRLHPGWFEQSLPRWAARHPGPIRFLHLDADLYSATKTVLDVLGDRIVAGTVLQFDEYFNYPGWQEGEHRAFEEFVAARGVKFEYLGYCDRGEQLAVRIVSLDDPPPPAGPR